MGARYRWDTYMQRFFLNPAEHPEEVETLLLPDNIIHYGVAYAEFDLSVYTNLKTLIMFNNGAFCKEALNKLHLENLYLPVNLYCNQVNGLKADNVYYVGTFDPNSSYATSSNISDKLKSLDASHFYYYDWSSIYFDNYASILKEKDINFEKLPESSCKYTKESFYITEDFSLTYTKAGITYVRTSRSSAFPDYETADDFSPILYSIDNRVRSLFLDSGVKKDLISDIKYDFVDARNVHVSDLDSFNAHIMFASSNNTYVTLGGEVDELYFVYDNGYTAYEAVSVSGDISKIGKVYVPNDNKDKFTKLIEKCGDKIEYYDELPSVDFTFTDNEGEHKYKTKSVNADIDYCLKNIDILAYNGESISENDYLEDKFAKFGLAVSPELQDYKIIFDCNNLTYIEPVRSKTLSNPPTPNVDHYIFNGWYLDNNYTNEAILDSKLTNDITLYGKFTHLKYNLKFNTGGITTNPETIQADYITELPTLTKDEQIVVGWYYDNTFTNKANVGDELTESTTLYAKWGKTIDGYVFEIPQGIYTSSTIDGMRLVSKAPGGLIYKEGEDVTTSASMGYAHGSIDNKSDYSFTVVATVNGIVLRESLDVKIDNTLGNLGVIIGADGNLYCGFNCDDYDNFNEIKVILTSFIKSKMNIQNPNVTLPEVDDILTQTYEGTFDGGNIYLLASGVNLKYSSPTTTVDEDSLKRGYTACDSFVITKDYDIKEAVREIIPYILRNDGLKVENYRVDVKFYNNFISLDYYVNDSKVISHLTNYKIVDSTYSYIIGTNNYHDAVILINKTKEDINFNDLYKDALQNGFHYVNDLEPNYDVILKEVGTKSFNETIERGNGSYYNATILVEVVDEKQANIKGQEMIKMLDSDGNEIKYEPKEESIGEKVTGFFNSVKEKMEESKAFKVGMIALGSVLGLLLIFGICLLIKKIYKWLKR